MTLHRTLSRRGWQRSSSINGCLRPKRSVRQRFQRFGLRFPASTNANGSPPAPEAASSSVFSSSCPAASPLVPSVQNSPPTSPAKPVLAAAIPSAAGAGASSSSVGGFGLSSGTHVCNNCGRAIIGTRYKCLVRNPSYPGRVAPVEMSPSD
jgi:hypothetical protein